MYSILLRIVLILTIVGLFSPPSLLSETGLSEPIMSRGRKAPENAVSERPAALKVGETTRDGRFIAYIDGTVLDTTTGLMWAANDNGENINWDNAKNYCESCLRGGYTNWRLPTLDELQGLYHGNKSRPGQCDKRFYVHVATEWIDITCFWVWSSETYGSAAAYFDFSGGFQNWLPRSNLLHSRALPVRSSE
jgi:hypothetical protein